MGTTDNKKINYNGVDVIKLICALLVVFLHTYCFDWGNVGLAIKEGLTYVGVPFFFIASGFFLNDGLNKRNASERRQYIIKYEKRIITMYCIWTVISLPVAIYNLYLSKGDISVITIILYLVRSFVLAGSLGVYWYILSLVYSAIIIYFAKKLNLIWLLYIVSVIFFVYGVMYKANVFSETSLLYKATHVPFGSENNFLTVGLFYMSIGVFFSDNLNKVNAIISSKTNVALLFILFLLVTGLRIYEVFNFSIQFLESIQAIILFLIAMSLRFEKLGSKALYIRRASTAIYLLQFPFILVFDYRLERGTIIDFVVTCIFCLVIWLACSVVLPKKINSIVFG